MMTELLQTNEQKLAISWLFLNAFKRNVTVLIYDLWRCVHVSCDFMIMNMSSDQIYLTW